MIDDLAIFARVTLRCDLGLWPLNLELLRHFDCHVFILSTKFELNRIIRGRVIDDLARLRCAILRGGAFMPNCSHGCVDPTLPDLAGTSSDHDYT